MSTSIQALREQRKEKATKLTAYVDGAEAGKWTPENPPTNGIVGPLLSPDERLAIIEHLKVRNDDTDGEPGYGYPDWTQCVAAETPALDLPAPSLPTRAYRWLRSWL